MIGLLYYVSNPNPPKKKKKKFKNVTDALTTPLPKYQTSYDIVILLGNFKYLTS